MTLGQRMDVEGILLKLGIAEYVAISFALEVTSLQQDVATRKGLGIWSKAEAIVDHRLEGLAPGTRSLLNHLWSDDDEVRSLRGLAWMRGGGKEPHQRPATSAFLAQQLQWLLPIHNHGKHA